MLATFCYFINKTCQGQRHSEGRGRRDLLHVYIALE